MQPEQLEQSINFSNLLSVKDLLLSSLSIIIGISIVLFIFILFFKPSKKGNQNERPFDTDVYMKKENILRDILKTKFDFYFIAKFYPLMSNNKDISKVLITQIKEAFYADVMLSTPDHIIKYFQKELSKKGLDILIIQFYFTHLNKVDIKFNKSPELEMDNKEIDNIIDLLKS